MRLATALLAAALTLATSAAATESETELSIQSLDAVIAMIKDGGEAYRDNNRDEFLAAAQGQVRNTLKDPDSAQFRNVRLLDFNPGRLVCGEVNAKNGFGAYVGFTPFVATPTDHVLWQRGTPRFERAANYGIISACGYTVR
jgi:hypothetical protein